MRLIGVIAARAGTPRDAAEAHSTAVAEPTGLSSCPLGLPVVVLVLVSVGIGKE